MERYARKCDATGRGMNEGFVPLYYRAKRLNIGNYFVWI